MHILHTAQWIVFMTCFLGTAVVIERDGRVIYGTNDGQIRIALAILTYTIRPW